MSLEVGINRRRQNTKTGRLHKNISRPSWKLGLCIKSKWERPMEVSLMKEYVCVGLCLIILRLCSTYVHRSNIQEALELVTFGASRCLYRWIFLWFSNYWVLPLFPIISVCLSYDEHLYKARSLATTLPISIFSECFIHSFVLHFMSLIKEIKRRNSFFVSFRQLDSKLTITTLFRFFYE